MKDATLIRTGAVGAIIAVVCSATPVLVIALGVVGLAAVATYSIMCSSPRSPSALA